MNRFFSLPGVALSFVLWGHLPLQAQQQIGAAIAVTGSGGTFSVQDDTRLCVALGQGIVGGIARFDLLARQGFPHRNTAGKNLSEDQVQGSLQSTDPPTLSGIPNPFSRSTTLSFVVGKPERIRLELYDPLGQRLRTLVDAEHPGGPAAVAVDLGELPSGSYRVVLRAGADRLTAPLLRID